MGLRHQIILFGILFLVVNQCNAPRRALITLGTAKEDSGYAYTSQNRYDANRDRRSDQSGYANESAGRTRETEYTRSNVFTVGNQSITDRETNYMWEPHDDNPTSMLRYQMEDQDYRKRLPRFEELIYFFDKVSTELRTSSNSEITSQRWLQMDGNYISSTETYTPDQKKLYRGIYWNSSTRSYESVNLAPGDLVNIVTITQ